MLITLCELTVFGLVMQIHSQYEFIVWMKINVDPDQVASTEVS